jgi:multisubunit Na+/H+ antiporter MnhB subunit
MSDLVAWFGEWIGWGWGFTFLIWVAGSIIILTIVYRRFMERFQSRLPTAAVFVLWTLMVVGMASRYLGFGQPGGR